MQRTILIASGAAALVAGLVTWELREGAQEPPSVAAAPPAGLAPSAGSEVEPPSAGSLPSPGTPTRMASRMREDTDRLAKRERAAAVRAANRTERERAETQEGPRTSRIRIPDDASAELRSLLEKPSAEARAERLREIAERRRNDLALVARDAARLDPNPRVRRAAVDTLDTLGETEALASIAEDTSTPLATRERALAAIGDQALSNPDLAGLPVASLIGMLDDPELWPDVMDALADIGDPAAIDPLWNVFLTNDPAARLDFEKREYTLFTLEDLEVEVDEAFDALDIEWDQEELRQMRAAP